MKWTTKVASKWSRWFAWHPVCVDWKSDGGNQYLWLCFVERKRVFSYAAASYEYREIT